MSFNHHLLYRIQYSTPIEDAKNQRIYSLILDNRDEREVAIHVLVLKQWMDELNSRTGVYRWYSKFNRGNS